MYLKPLKRMGLIAATAALGCLPVAAANAQTLTENPTYVRGCRQINAQTQVFATSDLSPTNRIGTLFTPGTEVNLTGVLRDGRAQIFMDDRSMWNLQPVGWVDASNLTSCTSTPPPSASDFCYEITAVQGLIVHSEPRTTSAQRGTLNRYEKVAATTNPPTRRTSASDGRVWAEVIFLGQPAWISTTGPNASGFNAVKASCD